MATGKYRVQLFGETEIIEIDSKDLLSIAKVAVTLGVSVETLRRWLRDGRFPKSNIRRLAGKQDYWLRIDVIAWQKRHLREGGSPRDRATLRSLDEIDRQEARRFGLLPLPQQGMERRQLEMKELLGADPKEFVRRHPNLRIWVKKRILGKR